jgi:peroxiredoxin
MKSSRPAPSSRRRARARMKSTITVVVALFAVTLLSSRSAFAQNDVHATLVPRPARRPAPEFHLVNDHGKIAQISDFRGKVILLNFWATSCGGCILEIPSFIDLQQKYGTSGFTAVGISADIPYDGLKTADEAWQKVRPFIAAHHMNYPILMGNDAVISQYGFQSYPATYLIDHSGHIAATYVGVVSKENVEANIKTLLAER